MPRQSKYHNKPQVIDGITFPSKREAKRYGKLKMLECAGVISDLHIHTRWDLECNGVLVAKYESDFDYMEKRQRVIEDAKGVRTPVYRLKKKMMKAIYGVDIREV